MPSVGITPQSFADCTNSEAGPTMVRRESCIWRRALPFADSLAQYGSAELSTRRYALVGFPPGGGTDMLARLLAQWLSERLGQQFVVESRPGGSGLRPRRSCARRPTAIRFCCHSGKRDQCHALLQLNFNFIRDIAAIAGIVRVPHVMLVHPSFPPKRSPRIAYAAASGEINMASTGNGTPAI